MAKRLFFGFLLFSLAKTGLAQSAFTLRYVGFTIHPFGDNQAFLEPHKFDKKGYLIANFGGLAGYEKFVWEDILSIKVMQGAFSDCSSGWAAVTHIGFRGVLIDRKKHRLLFGMGPTFYYRQDWNRFPDYEDSGFFHKYHAGLLGNIQYKMFWYGCEFEYDYRLNNKTDFNVGFTPGAPLALVFSFGIKYWVSKDFKKSEKFVIPE
jgi:hypothetical protein